MKYNLYKTKCRTENHKTKSNSSVLFFQWKIDVKSYTLSKKPCSFYKYSLVFELSVNSTNDM